MSYVKHLFLQYSLNDHLQGLSQRNWLVVEKVKVQLMAEERGGLQQSVELLFNHLIFFFRHLERDKEKVNCKTVHHIQVQVT